MTYEKFIAVVRDMTIILGILFISFTATSALMSQKKAPTFATEIEFPTCSGNFHLNPATPLDNITLSKQ